MITFSGVWISTHKYEVLEIRDWKSYLIIQADSNPFFFNFYFFPQGFLWHLRLFRRLCCSEILLSFLPKRLRPLISLGSRGAEPGAWSSWCSWLMGPSSFSLSYLASPNTPSRSQKGVKELLCPHFTCRMLFCYNVHVKIPASWVLHSSTQKPSFGHCGFNLFCASSASYPAMELLHPL